MAGTGDANQFDPKNLGDSLKQVGATLKDMKIVIPDANKATMNGDGGTPKKSDEQIAKDFAKQAAALEEADKKKKSMKKPERPNAPSWWKRLLHVINPDWFKNECENYDRECRAYEEKSAQYEANSFSAENNLKEQAEKMAEMMPMAVTAAKNLGIDVKNLGLDQHVQTRDPLPTKQAEVTAPAKEEPQEPAKEAPQEEAPQAEEPQVEEPQAEAPAVQESAGPDVDKALASNLMGRMLDQAQRNGKLTPEQVERIKGSDQLMERNVSKLMAEPAFKNMLEKMNPEQRGKMANTKDETELNALYGTYANERKRDREANPDYYGELDKEAQLGVQNEAPEREPTLEEPRVEQPQVQQPAGPGL